MEIVTDPDGHKYLDRDHGRLLRANAGPDMTDEDILAKLAGAPTIPIDQIKADARAQATRMIDAVGRRAIESRVEGERQSWPQQEDAARRFVDDAAEDRDLALLDALIAGRGAGESRAALATRIVAKAVGFRVMAAGFASLRSRTHTAIDAAPDAADVDAALAALQTELRTQS